MIFPLEKVGDTEIMKFISLSNVFMQNEKLKLLFKLTKAIIKAYLNLIISESLNLITNYMEAQLNEEDPLEICKSLSIRRDQDFKHLG